MQGQIVESWLRHPCGQGAGKLELRSLISKKTALYLEGQSSRKSRGMENTQRHSVVEHAAV